MDQPVQSQEAEEQNRELSYQIALINYFLVNDNEPAWPYKLHREIPKLYRRSTFTRRWLKANAEKLCYKWKIIEINERDRKYGDNPTVEYRLVEDITALQRITLSFSQTSVLLCRSPYTARVIEKELIPYLQDKFSFELSPELHEVFNVIVPGSRTAMRLLLEPFLTIPDERIDPNDNDGSISHYLLSLLLASVIGDLSNELIRDSLRDKIDCLMDGNGAQVHYGLNLVFQSGSKKVEFNSRV